MIYVFEKSDDKDYYKKAKAFRIENNAVRIMGVVFLVPGRSRIRGHQGRWS